MLNAGVFDLREKPLILRQKFGIKLCYFPLRIRPVRRLASLSPALA